MRQNFGQFRFVLGDTAARAAERIRRTHDNGIADRLCEPQSGFDICHDFAFDDRLAGALHKLLELVAILALFNRLDRRTDNANVIFLDNPSVVQLARNIQARLTAHTGDYRVRAFLLYNLLNKLYCQRLNVSVVSHSLVRHNRRGVRVNQYDLHVLVAERAASLRSRVVELSSLTDYYRPRAYYKHFFD